MKQEEIREIKIGKVYKHFKGKLYKVRDIVNNAEVEKGEIPEKIVVYTALYGEYLEWARPLKIFASEVDRKKYPNVTQKYRFEEVEFEK